MSWHSTQPRSCVLSPPLYLKKVRYLCKEVKTSTLFWIHIGLCVSAEGRTYSFTRIRRLHLHTVLSCLVLYGSVPYCTPQGRGQSGWYQVLSQYILAGFMFLSLHLPYGWTDVLMHRSRSDHSLPDEWAVHAIRFSSFPVLFMDVI